jgi:hypothetical protein
MIKRDKPNTGKTKIASILDDENKRKDDTYGVNGVLARLFRQMLLDLNINKQRWMHLMADFMHDQRNNVPNNKSDHTTFRGNLTKELGREQLTFKSLCRGCRFLGFRSIEITIAGKHEDTGEITYHTTTVDFGPRRRINEFMRETERSSEDAQEESESSGGD